MWLGPKKGLIWTTFRGTGRGGAPPCTKLKTCRTEFPAEPNGTLGESNGPFLSGSLEAGFWDFGPPAPPAGEV